MFMIIITVANLGAALSANNARWQLVHDPTLNMQKLLHAIDIAHPHLQEDGVCTQVEGGCPLNLSAFGAFSQNAEELFAGMGFQHHRGHLRAARAR